MSENGAEKDGVEIGSANRLGPDQNRRGAVVTYKTCLHVDS